MKTLLIYATKYGSAKKCVEPLKPQLTSNVTVTTIKDLNKKDLKSYDTIIVGGSVYMGSIQKSIKHFLKKYQSLLLNKKLGLFVCCYTPLGSEGFLKTIFPPELISHATYCTQFGGIMDYDKMNVFYRKLFQSLKKIDGFNQEFKEPVILEDEITKFATIMNQ